MYNINKKTILYGDHAVQIHTATEFHIASAID
jgi:hypothetical protein